MSAPTQEHASPLPSKLRTEEAYRLRGSRWRWHIAVAAFALMFGSILAANWVTTDYGFIPVGFGLEATAGTFFAGISLAARDLIQDAVGRVVVLLTIVVGTIISFAIAEPMIAVASAAAFGLAELFDFAIYSPLRDRARFGDRRWAVAVLASNVVGIVTDTVVFLGIAFGLSSIGPALFGQLVGKSYATVAYLVLGAALAWWLARRRSRVGAEAELR